MSSTIYRERVLPSAATFLLPAVIGILLLATLLPLNQAAAYVAAGILTAGLEALLVIKAPVIELDENHLQVGRARIERAHLGKVELIDREQSFGERGHLLDARAYTCFQSSVRSMIKIQVLDKADPTPYWLFSTREADRLVELLG